MFVKGSDQTIFSDYNKKQINFYVFNCFTGAYLKPLVCGLQSSTNVTGNSVLGIAGVLDPPLELYNVL